MPPVRHFSEPRGCLNLNAPTSDKPLAGGAAPELRHAELVGTLNYPLIFRFGGRPGHLPLSRSIALVFTHSYTWSFQRGAVDETHREAPDAAAAKASRHEYGSGLVDLADA